MAKSLFYRLLGIGKIPAPVMTELEAEGVTLLEEGVRGSVTYRNFRSPSRVSSWRRQWYTASIVLTKKRLLALRHANPIINVPLADERIKVMHYSLEEKDLLCIAFDAPLFHADWSGTIEYRFRIPQAQRFLELLT